MGTAARETGASSLESVCSVGHSLLQTAALFVAVIFSAISQELLKEVGNIRKVEMVVPRLQMGEIRDDLHIFIFCLQQCDIYLYLDVICASLLICYMAVTTHVK